MLAPIMEINIERVHASLSQQLQPVKRSTCAYDSLAIRKLEILKHVQESATNMFSMADLVSRMRSPEDILGELGLQLHPNFQPYLLPSGRLRSDLTYRCE